MGGTGATATFAFAITVGGPFCCCCDFRSGAPNLAGMWPSDVIRHKCVLLLWPRITRMRTQKREEAECQCAGGPDGVGVRAPEEPSSGNGSMHRVKMPSRSRINVTSHRGMKPPLRDFQIAARGYIEAHSPRVWRASLRGTHPRWGPRLLVRALFFIEAVLHAYIDRSSI